MLLPSEIEARYTIPALRAIAARKLVMEHGMKQQEVGQLLGVTQAAVSNYIRGARSTQLGWEEDEQLHKVVDDLVSDLVVGKNQVETVVAFNEACSKIRYTRLLCDVHGHLEPDFNVERCDTCESLILDFHREFVNAQGGLL
ncbi:MAG: helix-turn-helix domain-containing protein [Candidatus Geothermarchaeales archaeon]